MDDEICADDEGVLAQQANSTGGTGSMADDAAEEGLGAVDEAIQLRRRASEGAVLQAQLMEALRLERLARARRVSQERRERAEATRRADEEAAQVRAETAQAKWQRAKALLAEATAEAEAAMAEERKLQWRPLRFRQGAPRLCGLQSSHGPAVGEGNTLQGDGAGGSEEAERVEPTHDASRVDDGTSTAAPHQASEATRVERLQRARAANRSSRVGQHRSAATASPAKTPAAPKVLNVCLDGCGVPTTAEELARWTPICGCEACAARAQRKWLASASMASAGLEGEPG